MRSHRSALAWAFVLVPALVLAAGCGGDDDDAPASATTRPGARSGEPVELTASFRGVTAESIRLGIVTVDWECIADFIDFKGSDDELAYRTFVDELNDNGGVHGRTIEPYFAKYCPIGNAEALSACTELTEDREVFAVVGLFIDFSGDAQLCLSRDHETVHIGHELNQSWIDQAPPALLLSGDITSERRIDVLLDLLEAEGTLEGRTVAVLSDDENEPRAEEKIEGGLRDLGLDVTGTAVLTVTGTDTSAAQAQLDAFLERWKQDDVDTVVIAGLSLVSRQWVEKIVAAIPGVALVTDAPTSGLQAGRDAQAAGIDPNPYANLFSAEGETTDQRWSSPRAQECVDVYERRTETSVPAPEDVVPGPDGKREELHTTVLETCNDIELFRVIAERAGPGLTNDAWREAVHGLGRVELVTTDFASFGEGKYDGNDAFRLVRFDPSLGEHGDWESLGELRDTAAR